ncbi:MAG TPA: PDZ domain-containing protein [Thermoanaerobaculia bacterium]|nr:PDZ domain-containing protein [Thermoanaerobaculia bacterium]
MFPIAISRPRSVLLLSAVVAALAPVLPARAQPAEARDVRYVVGLRQPQTQMIEMEMRVRRLDSSDEELVLHLPTWRPGRYEILDPAGTVRGVEARSADGEELPVRKTGKSTWRIATGGAREVAVGYRVYANSLGDRTRHVDSTHAFLSPSSVFLYAPSHRSRPLTVRVEAPEEWRVASGLDSAPGDLRTLLAPDYDTLADSPIEVGLQERLGFEVAGVPHEIVLWPPGARYDAQRLIGDVTKIVETQRAIFGGFPYRRYVFLVHVGAGARGGTEHLNSTIMQTSLEAIEGSLENDRAYKRFLGLVSHELFHTWNVKALRPAEITPYDFQAENYSPLFWVAEGTTSYYDDLTLARAGLDSPKRYFEKLGESIDDHRRRPGASVQSLSESSFDAWIKFNRSTPDSVNSTVSFYSKGALVSLLLDLRIRELTESRASLDTVLRRMYEEFPLEEGGYTEADLQRTIEQVAGASFARFFRDHVDGTEPLPLEDALEWVGLELALEAEKSDDVDAARNGGGDNENGDESENEDESESDGNELDPEEIRDEAYLGLELREQDGASRVRSVLADGPAYAAGVLAGDEVVALEGRRLEADDLDERLELYSPGDRVRLHLMRYDRLLELEIELGARPAATWKVTRTKEPTAAQKAAYRSWLGLEWPEKKQAGAGRTGR